MRKSGHRELSTEQLAAYLEGEVTASEAARIEAELAESASTARRLEQVKKIRAALQAPIPELENVDLLSAIRKGRDAPAPARPPRGPWRSRWLPVTVAAAAIVVVALGLRWSPRGKEHLVSALGSTSPMGGVADEFRAKGVGPTQPSGSAATDREGHRWAGVQVYQVASNTPPERLGDRLSPGNGLLFSYTNLGRKAFGYLAIYAVDTRGRVHWFHPAYEYEGTDPTSIAIGQDVAYVPLGELIHHDFSPGLVWIHAVFSRKPLHVREIEALAARQSDPAGTLPLTEAFEQVIVTRVGP